MDTRSSENDLGISAGIRLTCIKHAVYVPSKAAAKAMATQFVGSLLIVGLPWSDIDSWFDLKIAVWIARKPFSTQDRVVPSRSRGIP